VDHAGDDCLVVGDGHDFADEGREVVLTSPDFRWQVWHHMLALTHDRSMPMAATPLPWLRGAATPASRSSCGLVSTSTPAIYQEAELMPKREISTTIPEGYADLLAAAKDSVRCAHISAARRVNSELVLMYLELGQLILDRQADEGWGSRVIQHLAKDLSETFPGQRGFSRRNLHYCRQAAAIFGQAKVQQVAALLPWGHVMVLVDKLDAGHSERQLENAMAHRMTALLAELGPGFAFVGRQVPLRVGESDFYLDLLFFHLQLRRFVVVELKTGKATPEAIGKLGFYLAVVDDQYRHEAHGDGHTIGILLTGTRDDVVVEYALGTTTGPMAAVTYQALPEPLRTQLPSPEALTHAIAADDTAPEDDAQEP
jgi:predicted nuclease of restriction endonuclease-like (RecB) superfamily